MGGWYGRQAQEAGNVCKCAWNWFTLLHGRNQCNTAKQLSSNLKNSKKNSMHTHYSSTSVYLPVSSPPEFSFYPPPFSFTSSILPGPSPL